jgi:hypothetical protein
MIGKGREGKVKLTCDQPSLMGPFPPRPGLHERAWRAVPEPGEIPVLHGTVDADPAIKPSQAKSSQVSYRPANNNNNNNNNNNKTNLYAAGFTSSCQISQVTTSVTAVRAVPFAAVPLRPM